MASPSIEPIVKTHEALAAAIAPLCKSNLVVPIKQVSLNRSVSSENIRRSDNARGKFRVNPQAPYRHGTVLSYETRLFHVRLRCHLSSAASCSFFASSTYAAAATSAATAASMPRFTPQPPRRPHAGIVALLASSCLLLSATAQCDFIALTDRCVTVQPEGPYCNADFAAMINLNPGILGARTFSKCAFPLFCAVDFDCCDPQRCANRCAGTCLMPIGLFILIGIAGVVALAFLWAGTGLLVRKTLATVSAISGKSRRGGAAADA